MARTEVLIAVIGVTGAGKTTFVSRATGRSDLQVGHGIDSCTQDVIPVTYTLDGRKVTLIDTPGFDDSERSDADILGLVAAYMADTYEQGTLLTGILFLQPINQPRLQGSEMRRTRLFKKLLGENAYQRVVIATTMWNQLTETEATARQNQRMSRTDVWGDMVARGAAVVRHDDTAQSAASIVRRLASHTTPVELQIQQELLANGGRVALTSAGRQLDEDLGAVITKLRDEIEGLRRERNVAAGEIQELRDKIERYERERQELQETDLLTGGYPEKYWGLKKILVASLERALPIAAMAMANECIIL
ncbi:P-loop containing nucleoside triphosphate hydrolase protein [Echria macrotheca]|uniref:P-loop containing nucleoside triphosphate hydrolase protein n=1 Tax=Echria macrotheca TaxID=438768 RepID=A0AAJ0BH32_9PEZI|nr:P-loop containing nucleoside triphosphate hydrolase protein [Echria macrotheca]